MEISLEKMPRNFLNMRPGAPAGGEKSKRVSLVSGPYPRKREEVKKALQNAMMRAFPEPDRRSGLQAPVALDDPSRYDCRVCRTTRCPRRSRGFLRHVSRHLRFAGL